MKKFFKYLGIIILLSVSFFYTEKTASVIKELDDIMIEIKEKSVENKVKPIQAAITSTTIIPGINGLEIDVEKSYQEMKYIGDYNENYLKYKTIYVNDRLIDNLDKYVISGNKTKNNVSLIFIVENNTKINNVLKILKKNDILATFMISGLWLEKNNEKFYELVEQNHIVGSIGYNYSYTDSSYPWLDNIIKRVSKEKHSFCLKSNKEGLEICKRNGNYTIDANIIKNNYFIETKKQLENGKIFIYKISSELEQELEVIIKYVKTKGYEMINIKSLLKE